MLEKKIYVIDRDSNHFYDTEENIINIFRGEIDTFIRFYDSSNNKGRKIIIDAIEDLKSIFNKESFTIDEINNIDINFNGEGHEGLFGNVFYNFDEYLNFLGYDDLEDYLEYEEDISSIVKDSNEYKEYILKTTFLDDVEKMEDFRVLTKDQFLDSYNYITKEEYERVKEYISTK